MKIKGTLLTLLGMSCLTRCSLIRDLTEVNIRVRVEKPEVLQYPRVGLVFDKY